MVTLHHFSEPLWLYERGGWANPETPALFARFVRKTVEALKEYCNLWITINEPNVFAFNAFLLGDFPPGQTDLDTTLKVMTHLLQGHALAYQAIHQIQKEARVGIAIHLRSFWPAGPLKFLDQIPANIMNQAFNTSFVEACVNGRLNMAVKQVRVPEAVGTQDFIGVNYYTVELVRLNLLKPGDLMSDRFYSPEAQLSGTGFIANMPEGLAQWLKWAGKFNLPVLVTENGVEDAEDRMRPKYLVEHIHQVWRASNFVCQVKGYFHWSLVDNFEWERGWTQRFGLWGLDPKTQMRIRRPSVDLYAAICQQNALTFEQVEKFAPAALPKIFPR
jgi:beta-glucosidase